MRIGWATGRPSTPKDGCIRGCHHCKWCGYGSPHLGADSITTPGTKPFAPVPITNAAILRRSKDAPFAESPHQRQPRRPRLARAVPRQSCGIGTRGGRPAPYCIVSGLVIPVPDRIVGGLVIHVRSGTPRDPVNAVARLPGALLVKRQQSWRKLAQPRPASHAAACFAATVSMAIRAACFAATVSMATRAACFAATVSIALQPRYEWASTPPA